MMSSVWKGQEGKGRRGLLSSCYGFSVACAAQDSSAASKKVLVLRLPGRQKHSDLADAAALPGRWPSHPFSATVDTPSGCP